jgi:outer membrane protein OmpA-like peptidoglycan-associated protein
MRMCKYLLVLLLVLYGFSICAQNKKYDWGFGVNAGLYSYSALLESKLTNPYEYSIGASIAVSRYLNNNFNLSLEFIRTPLNFPVNPSAIGEPLEYIDTYLYASNFTLKYKIDTGYIFKEHSMFAPYLLVGGGAYLTEVNANITYVAPLGTGIDVHLGDRTSIIFESLYNRDLVGRNLSYMQYNTGIRIHLGKANKKRVNATKRRQRSRRLEKIRVYRKEKRIAQARKAKEQLKKLQSEGLISRIPTMEEDQDLLMTNETIAVRLDEEPAKIHVTTVPPSKPKESSLGRKVPTKLIAEPTIPVSPGKSTFTAQKPALAYNKPSKIKQTKMTEEATTNKPVVSNPQPAKLKPIITETIIVKPSVSKPKPAKSSVTSPQLVSKPIVSEKPKTETPIKETTKICRNKEVELSEIGEKILFDKNRYRVRSRMHRDLRKIEFLLKECSKHSYIIIAHTDSDGNVEYNKKLSAKRAEATKAYLVSKGIDSSRLITIPYGASMPIAPNTSNDNKAKNRRIEFRLNRTSFDD